MNGVEERDNVKKEETESKSSERNIVDLIILNLLQDIIDEKKESR